MTTMTMSALATAPRVVLVLELTDPADQRRCFTAQSLKAADGDPEAMELDEDLPFALETGMAPDRRARARSGPPGHAPDASLEPGHFDLSFVKRTLARRTEVNVAPSAASLGADQSREPDGATLPGAGLESVVLKEPSSRVEVPAMGLAVTTANANGPYTQTRGTAVWTAAVEGQAPELAASEGGQSEGWLDGRPSVLWPTGIEQVLNVVPGQCLSDLRLDDVIAGVVGPNDDFQRSVWYTPCTALEVVEYRQSVVTELLRPDFRRVTKAFVEGIAHERQSIDAAKNLHYPLPADLGRAESMARFVTLVSETAENLVRLDAHSAGLQEMTRSLVEYTRSHEFGQLASGISAVLSELHSLQFELGIQSGTVWVGPVSDRQLWVEAIRSTFGRFRTAKPPTVAIPQHPQRDINHVEADVLKLVAQQFPETLGRLREFVTTHANFLPAQLEVLGQELRFYLEYLREVHRLDGEGVTFCLPQFQTGSAGPVWIEGMVDLALALGTKATKEPLVPNDLQMTASESVAFITGPNQGGKTTLARAAGQLAYISSLGLPVSARSASLPLLQPVLCHFPHPDDPEHEHGGLADEMVRLRLVIEGAGPHSLLILNELFSATSAEDAVGLSALVLERFEELGCRVLWVTFLEDLVTSAPKCLSLVGQVDPAEPTRPTFKFRAQPPTNRSHAVALAARHGLSSTDLEARLP